MTKKIAWQSHSYTFPKHAYILFVRVENIDDDKVVYVPMRDLIIDIAQIKKVTSSYRQAVNQNYTDKRVTDHPLLIKIELDETIPLEHSMWSKQGMKYSATQRVLDFYQCLKQPSFYRILTLPQLIQKGKEYIEVVMPLKTTISGQDLQELLIHLLYPVDEKATHAAIYMPKSTFSYDINTKKLIPSPSL